MTNLFYSFKEHSFLELSLLRAFNIFVLHDNFTAKEDGNHMGINFLESRLISIAVHV